MEEYTLLLRKYLIKKRDWTKTMFKIAGTVYRGVNNNRFTKEQALKKLNR